MTAGDTFPKLLLQNAERLGERAALREKDLGIWRETSWRRYGERVRDFSLGLLLLGLERGGKVAIVGDNRPEWVIAELAAQAVGGASVGIYQDSTLTEVAFVIDHCDAKFVVAEDQEQVDKLVRLKARLATLEHVIYYDPHGLEQARARGVRCNVGWGDPRRRCGRCHYRAPRSQAAFRRGRSRKNRRRCDRWQSAAGR